MVIRQSTAVVPSALTLLRLIYGNNENVPLHEDLALMPMSFYGITKMTSEHYLRVYHELYGINTVFFRFANVYGERQGEGV